MTLHRPPPSGLPDPSAPSPSGAPGSSAVPGLPGGATQPVAAAGPAVAAAIRAEIDARRWPDVARVPECSRLRLAIARRIVERALDRLPLRARYPDGRAFGTGGPLLEVRDPDALLRRLATGGLIGFGESYQAGEWDAPDLVGLLGVFAERAATLIPPGLQRFRELWAPRPPAARRNTPDGSRENIGHHYDLSNDLFALFLDPSLSYSAALFRSFPAERPQLPAAQYRKIDRILDLAGVGPGTRLLEIGTGWGELALRAAARGAHVTTVTLSAEQAALARERIDEAGHHDRVEVLLRDYRLLAGRHDAAYDAIVSVEMIEAVGEEFWGTYFAALDRLLAPGGRIALQAITMPHDRMLASRRTHTWIQKYIFPGGLLPSTEIVHRLTAERTRLTVARADRYGPHYAETLRLWRERFSERDAEVAALGFDESFRRMWTLYLAYSEAGFRSGYLDVQQFLLTEVGDGAGGDIPAAADGVDGADRVDGAAGADALDSGDSGAGLDTGDTGDSGAGPDTGYGPDGTDSGGRANGEAPGYGETGNGER